ncbi:RNA-directed DNA polymerase, eukaryota, reverse transcriptase zinc-binding domain protein [Tanacetum coccineum]
MFQRKAKEASDVSSTPNVSPSPKVQSDSPKGSCSRGKVWSVHKDILSDIKKSANKYSVLKELDDGHNSAEVNDVYADENGHGQCMENDIIEGCWNIRGLSTSEKHKEVRKFISDESLSVCAVIETRLKAKHLQKVRDFVFQSWSWLENKRGSERIELWKELRQYKRGVRNNAWAIMGDMNVTLDPKEHSVGSSVMSKDMNDFKDCVNDIEVEDVTSYGLFFTWTKNLYKTKSGDNTGILKKLDRAMGNEILICKYPQTHAIFLSYLISDHCPVDLLIPNVVQARKKAFRFSNFVASKKEFKDEVAKVWGSCQSECKMFKVVKDLKALKKPLKKLAWKDGDIFEHVKDLRERLKDIQSKIDVDPSNKVLREEESSILLMYNAAMSDEEQLLFQKAKIKWLSVGDMNNEYFHRILKNKNNRNKFNAIHDEEGRRFEGDQIDDMDVLLKNKLGLEEAEFMVRDVSNEEINAVKEFCITGKILNEINSTNIALVPKIQTPAKVSNYRPIACCNVIFKCISKILTERMKKCLGKLVSQNQSAFIPNRQIQDNILISQELLKGYDRKDGLKRVALKIDLQKAYDTVNWSFLEDILKGFDFHDKMVLWIMKCVTTTSYGDKVYVRIMKDPIDEFGKVSGLLPNYNKSTIIFDSVKDEDKRDILEVVPFKVEKLPDSWKNKSLSYARRLQLVASVLESIHVYWATVFLFPQTVIDEINRLLKGFLWNQEEKANRRAKVAWKSVWEVDEDINASWGWRNILKMRQLVRKHIFKRIGEGSTTSMWFDYWNDVGILSDMVTYRDLYDARLQANMTVQDFIKDRNGQWPKEWSTKFHMISQIGNVIVQHNRVDQVKQRSQSGTLSNFSVKQAYYDIRNNEEQVRWSKLVWFSQNIPKHAFILWLTILGRLTTQDKVKSWGSYDLMVCPLCCNGMDLLEHLFFKCGYSSSLWDMVKDRIKLKCYEVDWPLIVNKYADMQNGNSINSIVRRLCLAASVYFIWQERNSRIFKDEKRKVEVLFRFSGGMVTRRIPISNIQTPQPSNSDSNETHQDDRSYGSLTPKTSPKTVSFGSKKAKNKSKGSWVCSDCGWSDGQWWGICKECGSAATMREFNEVAVDDGGKTNGFQVSEKIMQGLFGKGRAGENVPLRLTDVNKGVNHLNWRFPLSGLFGEEVSRVLGGGLVPGSLVLVGGDPGVGKSTLMLQMSIIADGEEIGKPAPVLYVSGEESVEQIGNRADRMDISTDELFLYSSTDIEDILGKAKALSPRALIVDSIQTVHLMGVTGSAGGIYQVKECTAALLRFAKTTNVPVFLVIIISSCFDYVITKFIWKKYVETVSDLCQIGHVTKSGDIAGPRVLEHIVDAVLYMEGEQYSSHRLLRAFKNRFGSTDELGVFEMSPCGLKAVVNPSEIFMSEEHSDSELLAGSAIAVVMDGSRTFVIQIQALCAPGVSRQVNGLQNGKANMIISILMKQASLKLEANAIFLNVVGGATLTVYSSFPIQKLFVELIQLEKLALVASSAWYQKWKRGIATIASSRAMINDNHVIRVVSQSDRRHHSASTNSKCLSWRLTVETYNLRDWKLVPVECISYIGKYMMGKQHAEDCTAAADVAFAYPRPVNLTGDAHTHHEILDIDQTALSLLDYYSRPTVQFGAILYNDTMFEEWLAEGRATTNPDVLKLYNDLKSIGFKIVFISGTSESQRDVRIANLNNAGYYDWEKLLLKAEEEHEDNLHKCTYKETDTASIRGIQRSWQNMGDTVGAI